jgi:xanthine dehydrogenase YagS FAD-binding subunit
MNRFSLSDCKTVGEALSELRGAAVIKAGGTDLLDRMKAGIEEPQKLINIRNIASLRGIREDENGVTLGPLVTLAELAAHPLLQSKYTTLADAARQAATPQIRNVATIGGNLLQRPRCWYYRSTHFHCLKKGGSKCFALDGLNQYHAIFDNKVCPVVAPSSIAVALHVLDAKVELTSLSARRTIPFHELYVRPDTDPRKETVVAPDELLTEVRISKPVPGSRSAYQKYGEKESFDWAIADAGVLLEMHEDICKRAVIVMGSASPTPRRALEAESVLAGKPITEEIARVAGRAAMRGATALSMNGYKLQIFSTAIYRTILLAAGMMDRDPSVAG